MRYVEKAGMEYLNDAMLYFHVVPQPFKNPNPT